MLKCRAFMSLVALAVMVSLTTAADEGKVKIEWKFEKDKAFYQEMTTDVTQSMKVMGQDITQKQQQTFYFSWTPKEQKDKDWVIQQKITGVKMNIEIGNNPISYDSTKPPQGANPLSDFFKALVGSEFTLTLAPDMKVTKIDGRKEFLDKLIQANQQMKPLLEQILSEDSLKQMAEPTFAIVPGKDVAKGDKWTRDSKLDLGPIGTYETKYEYTLDSIDKDVAKITVKTDLKYVKPSDAAATGLPFKIKNADLKTKEATGTILFDIKAGRLQSMDMDMTLEGKLDIEVTGMTTQVDINQKQKTTIKTSDTDPLAPKK